jgi:hypothetical protein
LKEKKVSKEKKDVKAVHVYNNETTPEANEKTYLYTEPDDNVTKATKEVNFVDEDPFKTHDEHKQRILQKSKSNSSQCELSQSEGWLPWGLILFGTDEDLDAESQSSEFSCASGVTRENWDAESGPGPATIIYESRSYGVREVSQGAYEDEHDGSSSEGETQADDVSSSASSQSATPSQASSWSASAYSIATKLPDNEQLIVI